MKGELKTENGKQVAADLKKSAAINISGFASLFRVSYRYLEFRILHCYLEFCIVKMMRRYFATSPFFCFMAKFGV